MDVRNDERDLWNNDKFIIKLPYVSGGVYLGKRSLKYNVTGAEGIRRGIIQFLNNHPGVLGYIPFLIVQPQFRYTKEAKVSVMMYCLRNIS